MVQLAQVIEQASNISVSTKQAHGIVCHKLVTCVDLIINVHRPYAILPHLYFIVSLVPPASAASRGTASALRVIPANSLH